MIDRNPAEAATIPKVKNYKATVYDEAKVRELLKYVKGTKIEVPVALVVGLGLRRGEALGLKWTSIDFSNKKMNIETSLVYCQEDGRPIIPGSFFHKFTAFLK